MCEYANGDRGNKIKKGKLTKLGCGASYLRFYVYFSTVHRILYDFLNQYYADSRTNKVGSTYCNTLLRTKIQD